MDTSILVVNCGSSSVKLALYQYAATNADSSSDSPADSTAPAATLTALAERLGSADAQLTIKGQVSAKITASTIGADILDHKTALSAFIDHCRDELGNLQGIGHRVVHGGEAFHDSVILNDDTLKALHQVSPLAPLHNPMNLMGIELCDTLLPNVPNVAVFDTAFHQTMPAENYLYGVPYEWYEEHGVRRYGFHGTSYRFVSQEAAKRLQRPLSELNLLVAHLGNGCSACAIRQGQSVDSTMGLTPLEGLIMGTRSGDVDPGLAEHMMNATDMTHADVMQALNKQSGLLGLSAGVSNDMRSLLEAEAEGSLAAKRAIDTFCARIARHLAALNSQLSSLDALIFTGGIGEHAAVIRQRVLAAWRSLPFRLDQALNEAHGDDQGRISVTGAPLVMVIPTDEEGMIAQDTYSLTAKQPS